MMDDLPVDTARKICLCMSVTDQDIAACYEAGHRSLDDIRTLTRACTRCFGCEADLTSFYSDLLVPGRYKRPRQTPLKRLIYVAKRLNLYGIVQRQYHRHLRWRVQPMVFASVVVERPDLHSRVIMANVNRLVDLQEFDAIELQVQLMDESGAMVYSRPHLLGKEQTLVLDAREMIGGRGQGLPFLGVAIVQGRRRQIGSLRTYTHYFNDVSIASTHDQWTPDATRHHGFCTMVRVPPDDRSDVTVTVSNIEPRQYTSKVLLTNHRGKHLQADLEISPYGTALVAPRSLFGGLNGFLEDRLGSLRFENWSHRAMYYFFVRDLERNTWNVNHL